MAVWDPWACAVLGSDPQRRQRVIYKQTVAGVPVLRGGREEGLQGPPASRPHPHPWMPRAPRGPCQMSPVPLPRAITLENTLVILSTVAPDAGRYYVQAVNDKNGDNKTSQPITLAVESK